MKPPRFDYRRMSGLDELICNLRDFGDDARILAGGQSLMPMLNMRVARPAALLDINPISELGHWDAIGDRVVLGATVRHRTLEIDRAIGERLPLLARASRFIAHPAVRNRGTIGGSLALADPAAELPALALCLDAQIRLVSHRGERMVNARDFFRGAMETAAEPDEAITTVSFPAARAAEKFVFLETARRHGDYALAGVAARAGDGITALVFFGISTRPVLPPGVSSLVASRAPIGDIRAAIAAEVEVIGDTLHPAAYRLELAAVLAHRAGKELFA
jgi:CO/xanthine dehydrogenase FAD-binding subunit